MRVLLISPPYLPDYMRNARCDYISLAKAQWLPIWLSYCGALLENKGFKVKLIDGPAEGLSHKKTLNRCVEFKPDWSVVYSSTKSEKNDIQFTKRLKKKTGSKTVFVGPFVSIDPKGLMKNDEEEVIDFTVCGEFDYPVLELVRGSRPVNIKNLIYRKKGRVVENKIRPLLSRKELDKLPFVTKFYKKHLNLDNYFIPQEFHPFVDMFTGRGCVWGKCSFCLWVHSFIPGPTYNTRSVGNVISEIEWVLTNMPEVKEIFFQDDTLPAGRARELSKTIIKEKLKFNWGCYARADLDYQTLRLMKRAGCKSIHVGFESADQKILNTIRKGIRLEKMTRFAKNAVKLNLEIHGDFLVGLPGENERTVKKTISWAKKSGISSAQFSILNLYEKTPLYELLYKKGCLRNGEPSYPNFSNTEIRMWAKKAYKEFYFSWSYFTWCLKNPYRRIFRRWRSIIKMIGSVLWRRW